LKLFVVKRSTRGEEEERGRAAGAVSHKDVFDIGVEFGGDSSD
jgi:hypothetical protein